MAARIVSGPGSPRPEVSPEAAEALVRGGAVLVDVREAGEFAAGHAPGAVSVPLGWLQAGDPAGLPRSSTIVAVCATGSRSALATDLLRDRGFDARNLAGGMQAWRGGGLPVVRDGGAPGWVA